MKALIDEMEGLINDMKEDLKKAETNKAAAARVRKASLNFEKLAKEFRKVSIAAAKN